MRNIVSFFLVLLVVPAACAENTNTVFYFGAHPDDWQLREIEAGTFAALSTGLTALDHPSPWDRLHRSWLSRHYFRIEPGVRSPPP